jgi:hypothetical protein
MQQESSSSSSSDTSNPANPAIPPIPPIPPPKKLLPFQKTKQERSSDIKPIIQKLNELEINTSYPAVKRLYKEIGEYVKDGESRKINIAFPEVKRRIKGFLSDDTRKETWVKLEADD